jgi:hypothetical protein
MIRLPFLLIVIVSFCSCSNNETDKEFVIALNRNLERNNSSLENQNHVILNSLKERTKEPESAVKAALLLPKAEAFNLVCIEFENKLAELRIKKFHDNEVASLIEKFRRELLSIDSLINNEFANDIKRFPFPDIKDSSFSGSVMPSKLSMALKKCYFTNLIQQERILDNRILNLYHENSTRHFIIEDFASYSALVSQSSAVVEPLEIIVISAGMGEFTSRNQSDITVDGHAVPVEESGLANYKFNAPSKPG